MNEDVHTLRLDYEQHPGPIVTINENCTIVKMNPAAMRYAEAYIPELRLHAYLPSLLVEGGRFTLEREADFRLEDGAMNPLEREANARRVEGAESPPEGERERVNEREADFTFGREAPFKPGRDPGLWPDGEADPTHEGGKKLKLQSGHYSVVAYGNYSQRLSWMLHVFPALYDGDRHGYDLLIIDQTEMERSREYESRYKQLLNIYVDPIIIYKQDMQIVYINEVAEVIFGGSREQFIGEPVLRFIHPCYHRLVSARLENLLATHTRTERLEIQVYNLQNELLDMEVASTLISYDGALAILTTMRNVTDRKKAKQEVMHMAYHDELTGLPNRRKIHQELSLWIERYQHTKDPFAVITMDVDRIKFINDSLGHQYGDLLLIEISQRIQYCLVCSGLRFVFGRLSGDEFVILLQCARKKEEIGRIMHMIERALRKPYHLKGEVHYATSSIGIAIFPFDGSTAEELMRNSDLAMYEQKRRGKDGHRFFSCELATRLQQRLELENALRRSFEQQELELHYQPQFNAMTMEMIGVEALVRWNHPTRGLLTAEHFIPIAEENGLILHIGRWVIRQAVRDIKEWHDRGGPKIPVWVNLSSMQFQQPNLTKMIRDILQEVGLHPSYLGVEITERIMMDTVAIEGTLRELQSMGVQISLDDFGTGYSSFSYLQKFTIHKLKIDRSFIRNISQNHHDRAIITTIINMAKNLNLGVIAEGIETEDQLDFVTRAGCSNIQGYYFSHPLPMARLAQCYHAGK